MRIKTIVGLAFAGTAAALVVAGGVAYAADESGSDRDVRITHQQEDCPEKSGEGVTEPSEAGL
jgi:hypothetical protein